MGYKITYKKSVAGDLKRLGKSEARRVLKKIGAELRENPERFTSLRGAYAGLRRCRIGDYRAIFAIMEKEVLVLRVGHRKEVYRR